MMLVENSLKSNKYMYGINYNLLDSRAVTSTKTDNKKITQQICKISKQIKNTCKMIIFINQPMSLFVQHVLIIKENGKSLMIEAIT